MNAPPPGSPRGNAEHESRGTTVTPQKVLAGYESGRIVAGEAMFRLCHLAVEYDPATFADQMPAEWLADIRQRTADIPKPEEFRIFGSVCNAGPLDPAVEAAKEIAAKERYVAGLRTWKAYFESVGRDSTPTGEQP